MTTFTCDADGTSELIVGEFSRSDAVKKGWVLDAMVLNKVVDLCPKCATELETLVQNWGESDHTKTVATIDDSRESGVLGVGMDLTEGGTR